MLACVGLTDQRCQERRRVEDLAETVGEAKPHDDTSRTHDCHACGRPRWPSLPWSRRRRAKLRKRGCAVTVIDAEGDRSGGAVKSALSATSTRSTEGKQSHASRCSALQYACSLSRRVGLHKIAIISVARSFLSHCWPHEPPFRKTTSRRLFSPWAFQSVRRFLRESNLAKKTFPRVQNIPGRANRCSRVSWTRCFMVFRRLRTVAQSECGCDRHARAATISAARRGKLPEERLALNQTDRQYS